MPLGDVRRARNGLAGRRPLRYLVPCRRRRAAMPETVAPGVYVEETGAGAHVIAGVPTSIAAFVGATQAGPVAAPLIVHSFAEFEAQFGALAVALPLGYAVQQYFVNGGRDALIARIVPSGPTLTDADLSSPALEAQKRGLWLLDHAEHFNILCIPPLSRTTDVGRATWDAAVAYAARRRAMAIVDPPAAWTAAPTMSAVTALLTRSPNAALYYPRLQAADPLRGNQVASFAPCGAVAGIYARTDASRGVWKAPAGAQANVLGVEGLSAALSDAQLSALNAMGVNGLRALSGAVVLWGARTLAGDDVADPFKFVPLRRLDLFIEDSITRQDVDRGIVKLVVGFAPLRPAEFVIIGIGTLARDQPCPSFVSRHYRIRAARYALCVVWDGEAIAGVRRVRGLGQLTELVSVRDGGDPNASRVIVGPTKFEPVTLARGITRDDAFEKWAQAMRQGVAPPPQEDVRIELHDGERRLTVAWVLKGALPVKIEAPDLNADSSDVAMEELTLAYEGLEFDDNPPC